MRTTFRALLGFVLLLLVTAGIGFGGFTLVKSRLDNNQASGGRGGGFFGAQEPTYTVDLLVFERGDFTPLIQGFGSISAGRTADLRPQVPGLLEATDAGLVEGALIRQGARLFQIDPFDYDIAAKDAAIAERDAQARLATARADLEVERAALALATEQLTLSEADLGRQRTLRAEGVISAAALDNAENARLAAQSAVDNRGASLSRAQAAVTTAELAVERASLTLQRAERDLANTSLSAPFTGVAKNVSYALGRQVSTNDVLAQLVDLEQLELKFQLSDAQLGGLMGASVSRQALQGLPVGLSWDVGAQVIEYQAEIDRTAVAITENQGGIDVFATLKGITGGNAPPVGAFMAYSFPEPTLRGVYVVPAEAVSPEGEMFAVSDKNRIVPFRVDVVRRVGDQTVVAGEAIKEGDSFVSRRFIQLGEGTKVNPVRPEVPQAPEALAAVPAGMPTEGPISLSETQQACFAGLLAKADLPDRPKERLQSMIDSGEIGNPERLAGMGERFGLDFDSCFPAQAAALVAVPADPGGFPTEGPVDLTETQQSCMIELVENSDLPEVPKGFVLRALESGTIGDPGRMAGLKERAGLDLDSCFPPTPAVMAVTEPAAAEAELAEAQIGFPTEGPFDMNQAQMTCMVELVENSSLPDVPKGFILPALKSGTIGDPGRMAGLKERAGLDLDSCFTAETAKG